MCVCLRLILNQIENITTSSQANILFDEGSERTFVTQKLIDELELRPVSTENISISAFGSQPSATRSIDVVNIFVETENRGKIQISALVYHKFTPAESLSPECKGHPTFARAQTCSPSYIR